MKLIEDHSSYTSAFRSIASKHKKIGHLRNGEKDIHFVRVTLSKHPLLAEADIKEFFRKVNHQLKFPALVLVAYTGGYSGDNNDSKRKKFLGEFFILDQVKKDDFDDLESKLDETEKIGEEIIAYLGEHYEENPHHGLLIWNEGQNEPISNMNMGTLAGTKFYFTIDVPHQQKLNFNPEAFYNDQV